MENKHQHNEIQGFIACWVHSSANMSPHYYVLNELKENTFTRKELRVLFLAETAVFHPSKPVLYISSVIRPRTAGNKMGAAIACVTFNPDAVQTLDEIQIPLCWPDSYSHDIKVSPDGKLLIVASWGGGYALYRLNEAGLFDKPISTIHDQPKDNVPSSEAKPVETTGPLRLCLHSDKPVAFGAELKGEQITTLSVSEEGLAVMSRRQLREGSGIPHLAFDSAYRRLLCCLLHRACSVSHLIAKRTWRATQSLPRVDMCKVWRLGQWVQSTLADAHFSNLKNAEVPISAPSCGTGGTEML